MLLTRPTPRYTWSSIFSVLLITAYDFFCNFLHNQTYRVIIFVIAGFVLVAINMAGVKVSTGLTKDFWHLTFHRHTVVSKPWEEP